MNQKQSRTDTAAYRTLGWARSQVAGVVKHHLAAAVLVIVVVTACGGGSSSSGHGAAPPASPTPSASADTSRRELLFAALEPGGDVTSMRDNAVAIVRQDGTAKAKARFDARQLPKIGPALPLPQPEARVAAGKVFYADGGGVIRSLSIDGSVANVTTIPVTSSQQMLSFAVSPDGGQLVAAVFSFPPIRNPPPQSPIDNPYGPGDFMLQEWTAKVGQSPTLLARRNWPQSGPLPQEVLEIVGWSQEAPLATIDSELGTNQGSQGRLMFGHVAELDTAGRPGPPLGGYSCSPWSVLPDETVLCNDDNGNLRSFSVRSKNGSVRYRFQSSGDQQYLDLSLSPDGTRVAYLVSLVSGNQSFVVDGSGKTVKLPANFRPQGWLNTTTLVGVVQTQQAEGDMALLRLDHPGRMEDLGFRGFFAGVVQGG